MKKILLVVVMLSMSLVAAPKADFSFRTVEGALIQANATESGIDFLNYKNKAVALVFFGQYCPPCMMEIPELNAVQSQMKKDVVILGIHVQDHMSPSQAASFIKQHNIQYTIADTNDANGLVDFIMQNTGWGGQIPFMVTFDNKGAAKNTHIGMTGQEALIDELKGYVGK